MAPDNDQGAPPKDQQKAGEKAADASISEVQDRVAKEQEQGFSGTEVDPIPNEEYSIQTGPDSPTASDARVAAAQAEAKGEVPA